MRGAVLYGARDVRVVEREDPKILEPTDAIIRITQTCVCGSDLWPYRGIEEIPEPLPMGHEYVGVVEEVGSKVRNVRPGQFVVGSFVLSDNTCPICQAGFQSRCVNAEFVHGTIGTQAEHARIPLADGEDDVRPLQRDQPPPIMRSREVRRCKLPAQHSDRAGRGLNPAHPAMVLSRAADDTPACAKFIRTPEFWRSRRGSTA